jgi:hypothetical protein
VASYQRIASSPTGLHIHASAGRNANRGINVDCMRTPRVGTNGVLTGSFTATDMRRIAGQPPRTRDSRTSLLGTGLVYVNVHASQYLASDIRRQAARPPISSPPASVDEHGVRDGRYLFGIPPSLFERS